MNAHTRDLIAIVTSISFTVVVSLMILWHVLNGQPLDTNEMFMVGVLIALIAGVTGLQLPGAITRANGADKTSINTTTSQTTTVTSPTTTPEQPTTSNRNGGPKAPTAA